MDELPQLINVIIGDMSMVGPRPYYAEEIKYHLKEFPKDKVYFKNILSVKPGLTDIWQISGRNSIPFRDRLMMESDYSLHYNIFNDIHILLKTPFVVLIRYGVKGKNV
jgi:lipopolysaccharide/colanic/teichoic acid biosynthesis glycosyltransferase